MMTAWKLLSSCLALSGAFAAPHTSPKPQCFTDNYDDRTATPVLASLLARTGDYNGLTWNGWSIYNSLILPLFPFKNSSGVIGLGGPIPASGKNTNALGLSGSLVGGSVSLTPTGSVKPGAGFKSFDLGKFCFACLQTTPVGAATPPIGCTVLFNATTEGGQSLYHPYTYAYQQLIGFPKMECTEFPKSFKKVKEMSISIAAAGVNPLLTAVELDDFYHCNNP